MRSVCMLRGINVSGQKKIQMALLKAMFEDLGFRNVSTYIQSGNVIFDHAPDKENILQKRIKQGIKEKFGFEVTTIIRKNPDLKGVISENPFLKRNAIDKNRLYVCFLETEPDENQFSNIANDYSPEECALAGREIYLHLPNGAGRAKLNNNFFEQKLKLRATTRNWKTVNKLEELSRP